jgi:hypothetical protein
MKKTILFAASFLLLVSFTSHTPQQNYGDYTIVQVTSVTESPITFEASWIYQAGDSPLEFIEKTTPFVFEIPSQLFVGIFRKKAGIGKLKVALQTQQDGKLRTMVEGTAYRAVIVQRMHDKGTVTAFDS